MTLADDRQVDRERAIHGHDEDGADVSEDEVVAVSGADDVVAPDPVEREPDDDDDDAGVAGEGARRRPRRGRAVRHRLGELELRAKLMTEMAADAGNAVPAYVRDAAVEAAHADLGRRWQELEAARAELATRAAAIGHGSVA